ncbi:DUF1254 domain-containing protein [Babesia caballi]|uniref:DUF1254 domain-containing protein n=1 Tax=Babesia caballi TaxID=5871 RepID=A0AAV4M4H7_BABCB|nr:DUF1254 domain-containing protein [Babesia caballi]
MNVQRAEGAVIRHDGRETLKEDLVQKQVAARGSIWGVGAARWAAAAGHDEKAAAAAPVERHGAHHLDGFQDASAVDEAGHLEVTHRVCQLALGHVAAVVQLLQARRAAGGGRLELQLHPLSAIFEAAVGAAGQAAVVVC